MGRGATRVDGADQWRRGGGGNRRKKFFFLIEKDSPFLMRTGTPFLVEDFLTSPSLIELIDSIASTSYGKVGNDRGEEPAAAKGAPGSLHAIVPARDSARARPLAGVPF